ncbi:MAG: hypothetical protein V1865_02800 [bacterium]
MFLFRYAKKVRGQFKFLIILAILISWIFSGWPPIWNNPRIPPKTKDAQAALAPNGLIVMWPSTDASIPLGWSRVTNFDGHYIEGTTSDPVTTSYGNATHNHPVADHQHTIGHTHTGATLNATGTISAGGRLEGAAATHEHTITTDACSGNNDLQSTNFGTANNAPAYTAVIFIKSDGTTGIPDQAWALHESDTFPTDWVRVNGDKFVKGAATSGDGGGTGGSHDPHTHIDAGHTHTEASHTHTGTTDPAATGLAKTKGGSAMAGTGHDHTISGGGVIATEGSGVAVLADSTSRDALPPFIDINFVKNNTGTADLPLGIVAMWDGTIASIPEDWDLCDGSGSCGNWGNDKFINGANGDGESTVTTGGALTHTHAAGTAHSHAINIHTHVFTVAPTLSTLDLVGSGYSASTASHTHTLTVNSPPNPATTGDQTVTASANSPNDNKPPYKEIVFIKYDPPVAPVFSAGPAESTASTTASPTTEGNDVVFQGTATSTENWKLLVCKTSGVTGIDCDGGASDRWCVSASGVASGVQNTCTFTTTSSQQDTQDWYAYACHSTLCSDVSSGSGDSGSPFVVNNPPSFTVFSDDNGSNPGTNVTFSSTASDLPNPGDTIQLYVCKTAVFSSGSCTGGEWCHTASGQADNPGCTYAVPATYPDGDYNAYGYVIDNHGLVSSSGATGSNSTMTVNNMAPSILPANIVMYDTDGTGNLELNTEKGETLDFYAVFLVSDANSCDSSEIASAVIHAYRSDITQLGCDSDGEDNNNYCYANAQTGTGGQCYEVGSPNACTGTTDPDVSWRCEWPMQYHADPTDADTEYPGSNWLVSVKATDDNSADTGLIQDVEGLEMISYLSYDVGTGNPDISYGSIDPGATSSNKTKLIEATGNVGLDVNVSSYNNTTHMCTDYPTCAGGESAKIAISYQHYATSDIAWASMTALTTSLDEVELNVPKTDMTGSPGSANLHWKMQSPNPQPAGVYTGQNVIAGIIGEVVGW